MQAKIFKTAIELSEHQHDREVQEALCVQAMTDVERGQWLAVNWSRLQDGASVLYASMPEASATARCFESMEEKNNYERGRELQFALRLRLNERNDAN